MLILRVPNGIKLSVTVQGKISRDDVAELCVEALSRPSVCNTTFEVRSTEPIGTPYEPDAKTLKRERDWEGIIGGVNLQKGVTGMTIDGVYTGRYMSNGFTGSMQSSLAIDDDSFFSICQVKICTGSVNEQIPKQLHNFVSIIF